MSKETCINGHKWLTEVADRLVCPVCSQPPVPKADAERMAVERFSLDGHRCQVIEVDGKAVMFCCRR